MSNAAAASNGTTPPHEADAQHRAFGRAYWMLNCIEMFERLAYFGIRAVVPIYIMQATEPGGLHLTAIHKGWIYMWWAILQSWLPMFTGGIADRYGYKRVLVFAISANAVGYLLMAFLHFYTGFFLGILVLAVGTAFFKPALWGSLAQNMTKENSSVGWGIFYWVVNVGGVLAPFLATIVLGVPHSAEGWRNLFIASSIYTLCNLLLLLTFRDVPSGADKSERLITVFTRTVENIWPFWFVGGRLHPLRGPLGLILTVGGLMAFILSSQVCEALHIADRENLVTVIGLCVFASGALLATWLNRGQFQWQLRLPAFLLIMSCFWMMMYQLWDLHPNFITDWIDSGGVARYVPVTWREYGDRGLVQVPQQILLALNAGLIVALVVPITWAARRMRTLSAMLVGMSVATIGILVAGLTQSGWFLLLGIVFFSLGEMWTGPKNNEYLGLIAPPGKKGLYLGYVNIPVGVGVGVGSMIAGIVYDGYGEKATLALKELAHRPALLGEAARSIDWSDSLDKLTKLMHVERAEAFTVACAQLHEDAPAATQTLRNYYRYDWGEIQNLAYRYLADHVQRFQEKAAARKSETQPADIGGLAKALGIGRAEVFDVFRAEVNGASGAAPRDDTQLIELLWNTYGDDPAVLDDLALEFLAQGTPLLSEAVVAELGHIQWKNPVKELNEKVGIGRTKAFFALSAAAGANAQEVNAALATVTVPTNNENDRLFAYLASLTHVRFNAVAKREWTRDVPLLEAMIESSPAAKKCVEAHIDDKGVWDHTIGAVIALFTSKSEQTLYERLAEKPDLVQRALAEKDWSQTPDQARQLLRLSVPEARAVASVEVNHAAQKVTQLLWDDYQPQYKVWLPFATIGVLATFALAIFGQMAKRWADMNA